MLSATLRECRSYAARTAAAAFSNRTIASVRAATAAAAFDSSDSDGGSHSARAERLAGLRESGVVRAASCATGPYFRSGVATDGTGDGATARRVAEVGRPGACSGGADDAPGSVNGDMNRVGAPLTPAAATMAGAIGPWTDDPGTGESSADGSASAAGTDELLCARAASRAGSSRSSSRIGDGDRGGSEPRGLAFGEGDS
jgi:hypothetical protein